jgi:hypothetical protein
MPDNAHPPTPGPVVQPNFLAVFEALGDVTFPISKRDLLEQVGDGTVVLEGRNVELHTLIKDIHDDFFDDEAELQAAFERHYAGEPEDIPTGGLEGGVLPSGPQESWQSRQGPGDSGSARSFIEPE